MGDLPIVITSNLNFTGGVSNPQTSTPLLLLVKTDEDYSILFQRIFSKIARQWRIVCVCNAFDAYSHMMTGEFPDLLVTNLETSNLNAVDLAEWIRFIKCPKPVTILIFDHCPSETQEKKLAEFQVTQFLNKRSPLDKYQNILRGLTTLAEQGAMYPDVSLGSPALPIASAGFSRRFDPRVLSTS